LLRDLDDSAADEAADHADLGAGRRETGATL